MVIKQNRERCPYILTGMNGSPYSVKLRAILRYRHLPFIWRLGMPQLTNDLGQKMVPILTFPETGETLIDSTPIANLLEQRHPDVRSIIPADPVAAFISCLIADLADEWLAAPMFNSRWGRGADLSFSCRYVIGDLADNAEEFDLLADKLSSRQQERLFLVGCGSANLPVLDLTLEQTSDALGELISARPFLFGTRPSIADFAIYGQMKQLTTDLASATVIDGRQPMIRHWVQRVDDLSGSDGMWDDRWQDCPAIQALLKMAGSMYLPFLAESLSALEESRTEVSLKINDLSFVKPVSRYQARRLVKLRNDYSLLTDSDRASLDRHLQTSGCLDFLCGTASK